jgi:hypothetical protein
MRTAMAGVLFLICFNIFNAHAVEKSTPTPAPEESLTQLKEKFKGLPEGLQKFYVQTHIVSKYSSETLTAQNSSDAKRFAEANLSLAERYKNDWNYSNAVHKSNLVLGRLALQKGNVAAAKEFLKISCEVKGSPQLNSFGPNMTLAKELLEKKEKKAVLDYLDSCLKFWKPGPFESEVTQWKKQINQGEVPNFKGNLVY